MSDVKSELSVVAKDNQLSANKVQELLSNFSQHAVEAQAVIDEAKTITVTGEKQVELMGKARIARLKLKNIRVEVEHTRKQLKEESLREGKAVDGMANIIKALIVPAEEHLEKQEKFAEVAIANRKHERHLLRIERLSPFVENINVYSLEDMADDEFDNLVEQSEAAFKARQAAEREASLKRQADIEAEEKARQEMIAENARLKKEADIAHEKAAKIEAERKAEREVAERERLNRERETAAEAEKQRQSLLAPDKDKLLRFAEQIEAIELPNVSNPEAGKVLGETKDFLNRISKNLKAKAKKL
jgi:hypothetical protein